MTLSRVPAGSPPPPIRWWGNVFVRVWGDFEQLVVVVRLPWWREDPAARTAADWYGLDIEVHREQFVVSWRRREGFRCGWRAA